MNTEHTPNHQPTKADMIRAARIVWHLITFEPPCVTGDGYSFRDEVPEARDNDCGGVSFTAGSVIVTVRGGMRCSVSLTTHAPPPEHVWLLASTPSFDNLAAAIRHYAMHVRRVLPEDYAAVVDHVDGGR